MLSKQGHNKNVVFWGAIKPEGVLYLENVGMLRSLKCILGQLSNLCIKAFKKI